MVWCASEREHAAHLQQRRRRCAAPAGGPRRPARASGGSRRIRRCGRALGARSPGRAQRRNRYWMCCSAWVATKVPLPWRRTSRLSAASSSMALRTVPWLTRKRAARSISLGMASPGFHSPACRLCRIRPLICWYSGLNAGVAPQPRRGRAAGGADGGEFIEGAKAHILYKTQDMSRQSEIGTKMPSGYVQWRFPRRPGPTRRRAAARPRGTVFHHLRRLSHEQEARSRRRHRRRRPDRLRPAVPHRLGRDAGQGPAGHPAAARRSPTRRPRRRSRA